MKKVQARKRIQHTPIVHGFAERLRQLRRSRGMSQTKLATRAHIHWTYVGRLERGMAAPGLDLIGQLAEALNVSVAELLPLKPVESQSFLQEQARARLESLFKHADSSALGVLNAILTMMDDAAKRGR